MDGYFSWIGVFGSCRNGMYPRILNTLPLKIPTEKQQENLSDEEQQQEEEDITRLLLSTKEKLQPEEKDC